MNIEHLLKETLELSEYQVIVYISLLEKTGTPAQVLKRLNINRATLYRVIDELAEKGLIIRHETGNRVFYDAVNPEHLLEIYNKKKVTFEEKGISLQKAVYELIKRAQQKPVDTSITVERGLLAHYRSMKIQLDCKEKLIRQKQLAGSRIFDYISYAEGVEYSKFISEHIQESLKRNIKIHILTHGELNPKAQKDLYTDPMQLKVVRIIPSEAETDISFTVFDDITIIRLYGIGEDITVITIKNAITAQLMKSLFDYVFERSIENYKTSPLKLAQNRFNESISALGVGSSGIGGNWNGTHPYIDEIGDIDQIRHTISKGVNYIDACLLYGDGHTVEVLGKAIQGVPRKSLFINGKLTRPGNILVKNIKEVEDQCDKYLKLLHIDYLDQFQIHSKSCLAIPEEEVIQKIGELISAGKVKYWGIGNYRTIDEIKHAQSIIKEPLFSHEIPYGVYERVYEQNGITEYMEKERILKISYFTIKKGGLMTSLEDSDNILVKLADKYRMTTAQIALNWVINKPYTMAIVKSTNGTHVNQNIGAISLKMTEEEYKQIDSAAL